MRPTRRLACSWVLAALALALALHGCGPEQVDPLSEPTPFSFEVANPEEIAGDVYGVVLAPFEPNPAFGRRALAPAAADIEGFAFATIDATIDAAGLVTGSLVSIYDVPRINEGLGLEFGWMLFFPPAGCPMTATQAVEAALAPLPFIAVWDGETFIDDQPDVDGLISLETYARVDGEDGAYTETYVDYVPVASQSAWSASTEGPCVPDEQPNATLDIDVALDAGWQYLRHTFVAQFDGVDWSYADEIVTRTLDEVAAAGIIGEVWPPEMAKPVSTRAEHGPSVLSTLFR